jgi:hypothetical protein
MNKNKIKIFLKGEGLAPVISPIPGSINGRIMV